MLKLNQNIKLGQLVVRTQLCVKRTFVLKSECRRMGVMKPLAQVGRSVLPVIGQDRLLAQNPGQFAESPDPVKLARSYPLASQAQARITHSLPPNL